MILTKYSIIKNDELLDWIFTHGGQGYDVADMCVGLKVEWDINTTYNILRQKIKRLREDGLTIKELNIRRRTGKSYYLGEFADPSTFFDTKKLWKQIQYEVEGRGKMVSPDHYRYDEEREETKMDEEREETKMDADTELFTNIKSVFLEVFSDMEKRLEAKYLRRHSIPEKTIIPLSEIPDYTRAVVIGDAHIPHEDNNLYLVMKFMKEKQFDYIFLNGDMIDCEGLSPKFIRNRHTDYTFAEQTERLVDVLSRIRKDSPKAKIIYIYGNHEYRHEAYIRVSAPELMGVKGTTLAEILSLEELDIEVQDVGLRENYVEFGDICIGHWDIVRKNAAYTVNALLNDFGRSIIQGHVHRCAVAQKSLLDRTITGIENGCLCELSPAYRLQANWQHGFTVIDKINNKCYPTLVLVDEKEGFVFEGKHWCHKS